MPVGRQVGPSKGPSSGALGVHYSAEDLKGGFYLVDHDFLLLNVVLALHGVAAFSDDRDFVEVLPELQDLDSPKIPVNVPPFTV